MAAPNPALLARTARTLRERFESLRPVGAISAILAESPVGYSPPQTGPGSMPKIPFHTSTRCEPILFSHSAVFGGGRVVAAKDLWLCCEYPEGHRLLEICKAATPFVPLIRRTHDLPPDCGTTDVFCRWIWTVFSLAEAGVPYSLLALEHKGPFRFSEKAGFITPEATLAYANGNPNDDHPIAPLIRSQEFTPVRYWQLADLIEASIMVMDLVETAIPLAVAGEAAAPKPLGEEEIRAAAAEGVKKALVESKKQPKPRGDSTCELLRDLHQNIDPDFAETASEPKLGERIDRSPGSFPDSHYWRTVLQPKRRQVRAERQEAKRKVREAQRWGHFDSVGRRDEDSEAH
jgi:hypothetical protein